MTREARSGVFGGVLIEIAIGLRWLWYLNPGAYRPVCVSHASIRDIGCYIYRPHGYN